METPNLSPSRITGLLDDLIIDGEASPTAEPVAPVAQDYWRETRSTEPGISIVKKSTAKPKPPVDPLAPVQLPET
jgi:hypothetical protein